MVVLSFTVEDRSDVFFESAATGAGAGVGAGATGGFGAGTAEPQPIVFPEPLDKN